MNPSMMLTMLQVGKFVLFTLGDLESGGLELRIFKTQSLPLASQPSGQWLIWK